MRKYIAEFIGTLVLVLFACGTAAVTGCTSAADAAYLLTALAFGLVIVAMAYSIGHISGCHINPAVSIAMWISRKLTTKDFLGYVAAQFLGANGLYQNSVARSMLVEVILTGVFVIAILGVTSREASAGKAGIVIGLTLTLVHIFGIYFTGTSVNPARSFGPALVMALSGDGAALNVVWVFIVAPLIGGGLAAACWKALDTPQLTA